MGKLWKYFSGKKRTIAEIYWGLWIPVTQLLPSVGIALPQDVVVFSGISGLVLTYLGLGHAAVKKYIGSKEGVE